MSFSFNLASKASKCLLLSSSMLTLLGCNQVKTESAGAQLELLKALESAAKESAAVEQQFVAQLDSISKRQDEMQLLVSSMQSEMNEDRKRAERARKAQTSVSSTEQSRTESRSESEILDGKTLLGRVEWLWLPGQNRYFAAQIDTAIDDSLIFASSIMRFEREGEPWVRFELERSDRVTEVEAKLIKTDKFSYPGVRTSHKGLLISLPIELSDYSDATEFLVVERKRSYPQFVLGRNFLTDVAVVDVSRKYVFSRDPDKRKLESQRSENALLTNGTSSEASAETSSD